MVARKVAIRAAKIGLPLVAAATLGAVFLYSGAGYDDRLTVEGVDLTALSEGLKLTNPRFTGETARGEPFTVTADWALPDGPRPQRVDLSRVDGEINLADGRFIELTAESGVLRPRANSVSLSGSVALTSSDGRRMTADRARLDADDNRLVVEGDVVVVAPLGRIEAGRMRVERNGASGPGDYIWFENRVKVRIDRPNRAADPG